MHGPESWLTSAYVATTGRVYSMLKNWPERRVKAICLTDGERVGGLGDLGIHAIGCAISKLALCEQPSRACSCLLHGGHLR